MITYLTFLLQVHHDRAKAARVAGERGASALEWAIIAAVVVGLCVVIAATLRGVVATRMATVQDAP